MQHWWQLATRSWRSNPGRALASLVSVALGVGAVLAIVTCYESVFRSLGDIVVRQWLGGAHLTVYPPGSHWGTLPADLAQDLAGIDNVARATARLKKPMKASVKRLPGEKAPDPWQGLSREWSVDAIGIDPAMERASGSTLGGPLLAGRTIRCVEASDDAEPGASGPACERGVVVMERDTAESWNAGLGDTITLSYGRSQIDLTIIGLTESSRLADFQRPGLFACIEDVQQVFGQPGSASQIGIELEDASAESLAQTQERIEHFLTQRGIAYAMESTGAQQQLLSEADRLSRLSLGMVAFVVMLTAFFIILTTMSVSLVQRKPAFGAMRCIGATRTQLVVLLFVELGWLGVIGTGAGIALGIGVTAAIDWAASGIAMGVTIGWPSAFGVTLAIGCGLATTLAATLVLAIQVASVSPLAATAPEARPARLAYVVIAGVGGIALVALHQAMVSWSAAQSPEAWFDPIFATVGMISLYFGYVLIVPALVLLVGRPIAGGVGRVLGLRPIIAQIHIGRSPWLSAGICWTLLVGLSLIVYTATRLESLYAIWNFSKQLPQVFVWAPGHFTMDQAEQVADIPGVLTYTALADIECEMSIPGEGASARKRSFIDSLMSKFLRPVFVAGDPDALLDILRLGLIEGTWEEAKAKLARGGHVLIPTQTATHHDLDIDDTITITLNGRSADFRVAGVVQSAAFDMAVSYFRADSYMQVAAASAAFGTHDDLRDKFGLDMVSLLLCNLDVPDTRRPVDFHRAGLPDWRDTKDIARALLLWSSGMPRQSAVFAQVEPELRAWLAGGGDQELSQDAAVVIRRTSAALRYIRGRFSSFSADEDWYAFRERLILLRITHVVDRPNIIMGSLERMTQFMDKTIRRATRIATWMPSIALAVAALGIANLITVSVHTRTRQIAVMRATGALRSQIVRLILTEAITLGLIGAVVGLALGLHETLSVNEIVGAMTGMYVEMIVPVGTLGLAVALTVSTCVLAGIAPARRAARDSIIEAMNAT